MRLCVQALGFVLALVLLGWCIRAALSEENREQLERLGNASAGQVLLLLGLSAATLLLNGLLFWVTLRPVQRVPVVDHLATNALATFLALLPFKLGTLVRVAINNRRDRVPLLTIGAWYGVMLLVMVLALGPAAVASLWRRQLDGVWWAMSLGGAVAGACVLVLAARPLAGVRGLARLHRMLDRSRVPVVGRLSRSDHFARVHSSAAMCASPAGVFGALLLRFADLAVMSWRFVVAGSIVGVGFGWDEAVVVALSYYVLGMLSPVGMLGARDAGTVWMAGMLGLVSSMGSSATEVARSLTVLTLFVTGTESVVLLAGAAAGLARLRPDRLVRARRAGL